MKSPSTNFYWNDFYMGTALMSDEEVGQYIRLLCIQHDHGHLTMEQLNHYTSSDMVRMKFVTDSEGLYYNERLEAEMTKRFKYVASRAQNLSHMAPHMETHMETHMEPHMAAHMDAHMEIEKELSIKDLSITTKDNTKTKIKECAKPNLEDVKSHFQAKQYHSDPESFFNYYESNGWRVGKVPMKNWHAAAANWEKHDKQYHRPTSFKSKPDFEGPAESNWQERMERIRNGLEK